MTIDEPAGDLGWLWSELGLDVTVDSDHYGHGLHGMLGLALRRNPRRAHLLVSRVLGKHLPVPPATALDAAARLAARVSAQLGGGAPVVIGFCETATALGHAVADNLPGSDYLHTTRRAVAGMTPMLSFVETHSHATNHWLMPVDAELTRRNRPLVLVDDELSTGDTALGTIRALHAHAPAPGYVVATLFDARPPAARTRFDELADSLGVPVTVVSLLSGTVVVPPEVADRAAAVRARFRDVRHPAATPPCGPPRGSQPRGRSAVDALASRRDGPAAGFGVRQVHLDWPDTLPDGGRHGWGTHDSHQLAGLLPAAVERIAGALRRLGGDILVLGTEEFMYVPMRIADELSRMAGGNLVYQSTTRSPVYPIDVDGYAIRTATAFPSPDEPGRDSFVYNVLGRRYDEIVLVVDGVPGRPDLAGLPCAAEALQEVAPVTVVRVPAYDPAVRR